MEVRPEVDCDTHHHDDYGELYFLGFAHVYAVHYNKCRNWGARSPGNLQCDAGAGNEHGAGNRPLIFNFERTYDFSNWMTLPSQQQVSVIIPARNEEENIARVVRSLANQARIREILVVDDQSTDKTPEILAALKSEIPLLGVLRLDSLPEGWHGKDPRYGTGAALATGDWLLFTDADTVHLPGSLAEVLQRAENAQCRFLSLSPGRKRRHGGKRRLSHWSL